MGVAKPIQNGKGLKKVLARALNQNQILILKEVENDSLSTITSLLNRLSNINNVPLSTLKMNARILRDLGLIDFEPFKIVKLTESGKLVLEIMRC